MARRRVHAPGMTEAHHRAPPDLTIRRRRLCSGARPSAQPYVACATRSESLPITSRAGNDRNASPGELDFMHGGMTRRHEGFVSTMLTESDLSIALALRHFKCLVRRNAGCKPTSTAFRVLSVLTNVGPARPIARPAARSHILARRMHRQDYPSLISKPLAQGLRCRARCHSAKAATHRPETGLRATGERR